MTVPVWRSLGLLAPLCFGACTWPGPTPQEGAIVHDVEAEPERTLRAGDAFRGRVFGIEFEAPGRDRRYVDAWDVGFASTPETEGGELQPFASAYFWRRPDEDRFLRAVIGGIYNDVTWAHSPEGWGNLEHLVTLDTFTWPTASREWVDGVLEDDTEVTWGHVRPGIGLGYRRQVGPAQDNMFAAHLVGEVGSLYFGRGDRTPSAAALPSSTIEARARLRVRLDMLERNLLELPHHGYAAGADLVAGHRFGWQTDPSLSFSDDGSDYVAVSAYAFGIRGLPGLASEKHRLLGSVHVASSDGTDRFSGLRLGGGPDPRGEEYGLVSRPILPGAGLGEFLPEGYAVGYFGYRIQPAWFAFVDIGGSIAWLDDVRRGVGSSGDETHRTLGVRVSSGFFGRTRFQVLYAHDFDLRRPDGEGGYELSAHITGYF
jgi:hypothetical protein